MGISRSSLYGESIFTSFRSLDGKVPKFESHLNRFFESVNSYYFNSRLSESQFYNFYPLENLDFIRFPNHYFRLTFESLKPASNRCGIGLCDGKLKIQQGELPKSLESISLESIRSPYTIFAWKHKAGSYFESLLGKKQAILKGAQDALFVSPEQKILEISTSRIVFRRGNLFVTPRLAYSFNSIGLELFREFLMSLGFELYEQELDFSELADFESAFAVNSVKLLTPVRSIESREFKTQNQLCLEFEKWLREL
ncbi:MAG: hypothetical protein CME65_03610 [Halobacteriovoraceae bacterium]|nr:hypothetical protein [Halobacteriovoraceae bacterium]|tara:strand:- start:410 stop:1171 length:762 start_codon:yes stop_codon:yes gene_type:complete